MDEMYIADSIGNNRHGGVRDFTIEEEHTLAKQCLGAIKGERICNPCHLVATGHV